MELLRMRPTSRAFHRSSTAFRPSLCPRSRRRFFGGPQPRLGWPRTCVSTRASADKFDLSAFHEAEVGEVGSTGDNQAVVDLRLKDGRNSILKVYIGRSEAESMRHARGEITLSRPNSHDAMTELMGLLNCRVVRVCITELRRLTYYARMYLLIDRSAAGGEIAMDIRPSDAISIAMRVGAEIYVDKGVARAMAKPPEPARPALPAPTSPQHVTPSFPGTAQHLPLSALTEAQARVVQSCQEEAAKFVDPTTLHCVLLQVAIAEERFNDAAKLQSIIAQRYATHSGARALVAMQAALMDGRYEEAAFHRDELRQYRLQEFQRSAAGSAGPEDDYIANDSGFE